ncbi:MAG: AAA family ATPase, partial [Clostridia bacterium]|nr:AAA family ATPase [Clostridia bacterium]
MLCSLTIENIALIEKAFIDFQDGFTTLTGETGAGKSIIIDAVNLVLGERADRDLIRTGEEFAAVDALFVVGEREEKVLEEMGIPTENGEVVLSRRITRSGRSTCRINGALVTLTQMQSFTSMLVDIHGQHDHQSLLREEQHALYLDSYAQKELSDTLSGISASYKTFTSIRTRMRQLTQNSRETERMKDILSYEIAEIDAVHLKNGEEEELTAVRDKNRNAEKILSSLHTAQEAFSAESRGIIEQVQKAAGALEGIRQIMPEYQELYNSVQEIYYMAQDAGYTLRDTLDTLDFDPAEADRVEQRLDTIHVLEKKYGSTIAEILEWREE